MSFLVIISDVYIRNLCVEDADEVICDFLHGKSRNIEIRNRLSHHLAANAFLMDAHANASVVYAIEIIDVGVG